MGKVPDGPAVLEAYDALDRADPLAVERYNALSFAYFYRDDVEDYAPGRIVVRVPAVQDRPAQLELLDEWSSSIADPHERRRVYLMARQRGEV